MAEIEDGHGGEVLFGGPAGDIGHLEIGFQFVKNVGLFNGRQIGHAQNKITMLDG